MTELFAHVNMIHLSAGTYAGRGKLVVATFGEDPSSGVPLAPRVEHFAIGDVAGMVERVKQLAAEPHRNVYIPPAIMHPDLGTGHKGGEADVVAVLAIVADFDDPEAPNYAARLPLPADYVLETSQGRFQAWYRFPEPIPVTDAKPLALALRDATGCDHGTIDMSHVWRVPGVGNWPTKKKAMGGRPLSPQPVRVVKSLAGTSTDPTVLRKAFGAVTTGDVLPKAPTPAEWTTGPRDNYGGLADDGELLAAMFKSQSAQSAFGGKATARDRWEGNVEALSRTYPDPSGTRPYDASAADAGLAQDLAYWTGCDCERILRLMMRSALRRDKWEDREDYLRRTILNACARQEAVAAGGRNPAPASVGGTAPPPPPPRRPVRFLTPAECAAAPPRGYIVKGLIAPEDLALIFGGPGVGKSCLAPRMAYAIAQGGKFFGRRVRAGRVLYVACEDPHGMRQRIHALRDELGDTSNLLVAEGLSDFMTPDGTHRTALEERIAAFGPSVVFLDTVAAGFPGLKENESGPEGMGAVVTFARGLIARHGVAVVLLHHVPKADASTPRGHGLLHGDADIAFSLAKNEDGTVRITMPKNRNGPSDAVLAFTVRPVSIGTDEDGDPLTAPVADQVDGMRAMGGPHLPPQPRHAMNILATIIAASGEPLSQTDGFPVVLTRGVKLDLWRTECVALHLSKSTDPENQGRAFRDAFQKLQSAGLVEARDEWVWLSQSMGGRPVGSESAL